MRDLLESRTQPEELPRYLLFARTEGGTTGAGDDLVGVFAGEEEARRAFRVIRLSEAYRYGWGELVRVDEDGRPTPLCWFGEHSASYQSTRLRAQTNRRQGGIMQTKEKELAPPAGGDRLRERRPRTRIVALLAGLAALTTIAVGALQDDGGAKNAPGSTEPVIPFILTDPPAPESGGTVDG